jgi:hypothetical protein
LSSHDIEDDDALTTEDVLVEIEADKLEVELGLTPFNE